MANSINKLLIQRADCGTYLLVRLTKTLFKIFQTLLSGIDAGKKLKIFVCDIMDFHISFSNSVESVSFNLAVFDLDLNFSNKPSKLCLSFG